MILPHSWEADDGSCVFVLRKNVKKALSVCEKLVKIKGESVMNEIKTDFSQAERVAQDNWVDKILHDRIRNSTQMNLDSYSAITDEHANDDRMLYKGFYFSHD